MAASLKSDEELVDWFRQRLVWDDPAVVVDLLKRGLFSRIYTPQVLAGSGFGVKHVASLGVSGAGLGQSSPRARGSRPGLGAPCFDSPTGFTGGIASPCLPRPTPCKSCTLYAPLDSGCTIRGVVAVTDATDEPDVHACRRSSSAAS